jgi:hypothetical protein
LELPANAACAQTNEEAFKSRKPLPPLKIDEINEKVWFVTAHTLFFVVQAVLYSRLRERH